VRSSTIISAIVYGRLPGLGRTESISVPIEFGRGAFKWQLAVVPGKFFTLFAPLFFASPHSVRFVSTNISSGRMSVGIKFVSYHRWATCSVGWCDARPICPWSRAAKLISDVAEL